MSIGGEKTLAGSEATPGRVAWPYILARAAPCARRSIQQSMPSSKLHPLLIAAGLVALVAVNLAVMAGLLWLLEESLSRPTSILFRNVFPQIGFGMLIAQVILVGY